MKTWWTIILAFVLVVVVASDSVPKEETPVKTLEAPVNVAAGSTETKQSSEAQQRTKRAPILLGKALVGGALLGAGALGVGALGVGALGAGALGAGVLGAGLYKSSYGGYGGYRGYGYREYPYHYHSHYHHYPHYYPQYHGYGYGYGPGYGYYY